MTVIVLSSTLSDMDQNICQQGAVTMKTPFRFGIHGVYYNGKIFCEISGLDEIIKEQIVKALNNAYKCGFSDCFDAVKNKDTYIEGKMNIYKDLYTQIHLPKTIDL